MKQFISWLQGFAIALGGPGLFIIAFLDASFVSLPEINDLLIVLMITQHKHRMIYYASMATLGSLAGCMVLYYFGRRGGEALLKKRFNEHGIERTLKVFRRYGVMAILIPALLPPPAPFKIFVLLAGVSGMRAPVFAATIAVGRGIRYLGEGLLAVWYGDRALDYIQRNGPRVSLQLAGVAAVVALGYYLYRSRVASRR